MDRQRRWWGVVAQDPTAYELQVLDSSPDHRSQTQTLSAPPPCLHTRATRDTTDLGVSSRPAPSLLRALSAGTWPLCPPSLKVAQQVSPNLA